MSNTISATGLNTGVKHNVIPATASATLDCRLVPGYERERFIDEVRKTIDDSKVEIDIAFASESPTSSHETELYDVIRDVCAEVMPEAALLPRVTAGFTDSRTLRRIQSVKSAGTTPIANSHLQPSSPNAGLPTISAASTAAAM